MRCRSWKPPVAWTLQASILHSMQHHLTALSQVSEGMQAALLLLGIWSQTWIIVTRYGGEMWICSKSVKWGFSPQPKIESDSSVLSEVAIAPSHHFRPFRHNSPDMIDEGLRTTLSLSHKTAPDVDAVCPVFAKVLHHSLNDFSAFFSSVPRYHLSPYVPHSLRNHIADV